MTTDGRIGSVIAGYRIETLVSRGGMGVVYRAHDTALDRKVALKLISPDRAEDHDFRERFLRESRIAASIDHANIVPIHDAGEYGGELFIAMRYVDGTDLDALLDEVGPLEPARALALIRQVASALDAAHAHGLTHRDVKPANILVTPEMGRDEHVYLTDFGLSRDSGQRTEGEDDETVVMRASNSLGTIDYAAPEQIEGQATDARTDIYALGCVLYETLTGEPPFKATSPVHTLFSHLSDEPPAASQQEGELDSALDTVFERALAKDPEERYESATAMVDAAADALMLRPGFMRWLRPVRAALAAVVAIAAIAAVTLAVTLTTGGDSGDPRSAIDDIMRQPGTLSRIDPATNTVTASIEIGPEPNAIAVGDDIDVAGEEQVWITHVGDNSIWRVDAETFETKKASANGTPYGITVDRGKFWVADEEVTSGATQNVGGNISNATTHPTAISARTQEIWIAGRGGVSRLTGLGTDNTPGLERSAGECVPIETRAGSETSHEYFSDLETDGESVWVTGDAHDPTLWRIDGSTRMVTGTIRLPSAPHSIAVTSDSVWVTGQLEDVVWRVDPATDQIVATIPVGRGASGIAVGGSRAIRRFTHSPPSVRSRLASQGVSTVLPWRRAISSVGRGAGLLVSWAARLQISSGAFVSPFPKDGLPPSAERALSLKAGWPISATGVAPLSSG